MPFFESINYAASHEDGRSELHALALGPSSRVLCVTGSGARVLDLLVAEPAEIVAVDINPAQTHLLALKLAAMQTLSYEEYVGFIGLVPWADRGALYPQMRPLLPRAAQQFWDKQSGAISAGILYCGRWERFLRLMVAPAAWTRRHLIQRLFACSDVREQQVLWLNEWNTSGWERYLRALASRWVWTYLVREPGMRHIPRQLDIVHCIKQRFDSAAGSFLFRESPWTWLVFHGYLSPSGPLPPHLQPEHFAALRRGAGRITAVTGSLLSYLRAGEAGRFSAFSLSDFGSYADDHAYEATWKAIAAAAESQARFCERQFLVPRDPAALQGISLWRDAGLEAELARLDNSVVYALIAGSLGPRPTTSSARSRVG